MRVALSMLVLLAACSTAPDLTLPSPFAPQVRAVGDGNIETATMTTLVVRYNDGKADTHWQTWTDSLQRAGFQAPDPPGNALGMRFATFHSADASRKLLMVRRGQDVVMQVNVE